ncbi:MAG: DUF1211 domain-containing protein [Verrucomicrobia bacterium]|nr:DUF1211 domain-containing protein [Verrucomicrobiota bacterium]
MDTPASSGDSANDSFHIDRLASLSDGVFAVSMTLLAYNVHLPHGSLTEVQLRAQLAEAVPDVRALILSFCVAAMFWRGNQHLLRLMRQNRYVLQYPTLVFLLSMVFLPITTSLYGTYGTARPAALIYSSNLALIALLQLLLRLWVLSGGTRLLRFRFRNIAPALYVAVILVTSVLLCFVDPKLSEVLWFAALGGPIVARFT